MSQKTKQVHLTVQAGKRLIAKSILAMPRVLKALKENTVVIVAGTTNSYLAEEVLSFINQCDDFSRFSFFRGINIPAGKSLTVQDKAYENKDVVIEKGKWIKGKNIFDVAKDLKNGDIIFKGANAVNEERTLAAIQIAHPEIGTSAPILQASVGRRVELMLPIGIEKRVFGDLAGIAQKVNDPNASGLRLLPITGTILTELEALKILFNVEAEVIASGGVNGAEGGTWFLLKGSEEELSKVNLIEIAKEPSFIE